jgi:Flp pilus assembly protein TadG
MPVVTVKRVGSAESAEPAAPVGPVEGSSARLRRRLRDDRGSGAAAVLIFALVFMTLAAFVVDGGLSIAKRERAADIAEQAARYAAQDIDVDALRNAAAGAQPQINYQDCTNRVRQFVRSVNLSAADRRNSYCTSATAQRVEVRVQITYQPILSGFYRKHITVVGTAAAVSITGPAN